MAWRLMTVMLASLSTCSAGLEGLPALNLPHLGLDKDEMLLEQVGSSRSA